MAINTKAMAGVRAKRAKIIVEMGIIRREGNEYIVGNPTQKNIEYRVYRDDARRVCCSCGEFAELAANDAEFRCEHILAVKELASRASQPENESQERPSAAAELDQAAPLAEPSEEYAMEFQDCLAALSKPLDPKLIKTRYGYRDKQGNAHYLDYVEWHVVADLLDSYCPDWSHSVKSIQQIGDFAVCIVAITIKGVTREGVGTGEAHSETGIKKAEHDALKRAAVKFGVARALYKDEDGEHGEESQTGGRREYQKQSGFPRDPLAKDLDDLVTPRQLIAIDAIARAAGVDKDSECRELLNCDLKELNRKAASAFIDHLKAKQGNVKQFKTS